MLQTAAACSSISASTFGRPLLRAFGGFSSEFVGLGASVRPTLMPVVLHVELGQTDVFEDVCAKGEA